MASRSTNRDEFEFFSAVLKGDTEAIPLIVRMAEGLGWKILDMESYMPIPKAVVYTHYLTWLGQFASPGEQVLALTVNLPVWGSNCSRLSKALKKNYDVKETAFLDLFAQPTMELEKLALLIINCYLTGEERMRRAARFIQAYELMFWDGIYGK